MIFRILCFSPRVRTYVKSACISWLKALLTWLVDILRLVAGLPVAAQTSQASYTFSHAWDNFPGSAFDPESISFIYCAVECPNLRARFSMANSRWHEAPVMNDCMDVPFCGASSNLNDFLPPSSLARYVQRVSSLISCGRLNFIVEGVSLLHMS